MALFGVRNNQTDVVQSALEAACEMHELFCRLRDRWSSHTESLGGIGLGCGIATGSVVAGRFGAAGLSEFSVIGEPANLASRIQGLAEDGQVAMCSSTRLVLRNSLVGLEEHDRQYEKELKGLGKRTIFVLDMTKARRLLRPSIRPPSPTTQNEPETLRQVPTTVTQSTGGEVIPIGFPASGDLRDLPRSDLDILTAFDGDAKDSSA
jgi:adenylate cyclase